MHCFHELSLLATYTQAFTIYLLNVFKTFSFWDAGLNLVADLAVNISALCQTDVA